MARFIAAIADALVFILIGIFFMYLHAKKKVLLFRSNKWALIIALLFFIYAIYKSYDAYHDYLNTRIPYQEQLEELLASKGVITENDLIYHSPDGYQILIPKGFRYCKANGIMSLVAAKELDDTGRVCEVIAKIKARDELPKIVEEIFRTMKSRNPTYSFSSRRPVYFGEIKGIRSDMELTGEVNLLKGIIVFCKKDDSVYQLMFLCPKNSFKYYKPEFERILSSFRFIKHG